MTRDELSLLLFFETRAVDYGGRVQTAHMNKDDFKIAERWVKKGFVEFGRIMFKDHTREGTHWVKLSEAAWYAAHVERIARANRMWAERSFLTTEEKQAATVG